MHKLFRYLRNGTLVLATVGVLAFCIVVILYGMYVLWVNIPVLAIFFVAIIVIVFIGWLYEFADTSHDHYRL